MRSNRLWAGISCGVALGIGAVAVVGATTPSAEAASTFTVTPQQLQINQNISSAAVLRSNRALNYLAPIRTTQTDNANTGNNGVKALNSIPGSGQGWTVGQLAPGQKQYWANVAANGALTSSSGPTSGTGAVALARLYERLVAEDFNLNRWCCWNCSASSTSVQAWLLVAAGGEHRHR